jgi:hypothetical protein
MKVKPVYIVLGLAALGGLYWLYNQVTQKISFGFPSIRFENLTLTSVNIKTEWPVTNDSQVTVSVDGFTGGIFQGQKEVANVVINTPTTLAAGQTVTLTSIQNVQFLNALSTIYTSIATGTWDTPLKLRGKLIVDGAPIPVNMDLNMLPV